MPRCEPSTYQPTSWRLSQCTSEAGEYLKFFVKTRKRKRISNFLAVVLGCFIYLFVCLSVCLSVCVCMSVCLSVCLFIYLFIYLFIIIIKTFFINQLQFIKFLLLMMYVFKMLLLFYLPLNAYLNSRMLFDRLLPTSIFRLIWTRLQRSPGVHQWSETKWVAARFNRDLRFQSTIHILHK